MTRRTFVQGLFAVISLPVCSLCAAGAYVAATWLFAHTVARPGPYTVLVSGLFAMWSVVLFGFLLEQADSVANRLVPAPLDGRQNENLRENRSMARFTARCRAR